MTALSEQALGTLELLRTCPDCGHPQDAHYREGALKKPEHRTGYATGYATERAQTDGCHFVDDEGWYACQRGPYKCARAF